MGRSVSTLRNADKVFYITLDNIEEECDYPFVWENFIDDLNYILSSYKSLDIIKKWEGNEVHIIRENKLIEIGISEYCGLVSISLRAKENDYYHNLEGLGKKYIERISRGLENRLKEAFSLYSKQGTFSNGESIYSKVN